jgi:hypothetical protein
MSRRSDIDSMLDEAEATARDEVEKQARGRMLWPNPNPEGELAEAWAEYEQAYARHLYGFGEPTLTGLDTATELAAAWERYQEAVMGENQGVES